VPTLAQLALRNICDLTSAQLAGFVCGNQGLDSFLTESARDYSMHGLTETVVAYAQDDVIPVGFFSLSADGLPLNLSEAFELGLPFECSIKYFPAIKITKLAVRSDLQSAGIGRELTRAIEAIAYGNSVSVRLLTVDADNNPRTIQFYERNGFKAAAHNKVRQSTVSKKRPQRGAQDDAPRTVLMYRDLYSPEGDTPLALPTPDVAELNQNFAV
jgi:ribosomal protein S18 acetylase RimI-like enzyme